jgi:16S rRNA (guanine527-N7)-methyltransferase
MSEPACFRDLLREAVSPFADLPVSALDSMERHYHLLLKWNRVVNLTRVTQLESAVRRHYAESFFLAACSPERPGRIADLGSGPGFPGFPLAAFWPDAVVTLVESDARKAAFLRECRDFLPNLRVECMRAEDLIDSFDAVVSRAVRPADVLRVARRTAKWAGLLVSDEDVTRLGLMQALHRPVPGGGRGVAVWVDVSRET